MADEGAGVGGPLSAREVGEMVGTIAGEWTVDDVTFADAGTDAVYFLTVKADGDRREVVLKARQRVNPGAFRPEPYLLDAISRETEIPVPSVYGVVDDHPDLAAPFFLMERCPGTRVEEPGLTLSGDALDRVAYEAGRYLGQLHGLGEFARFGMLRLRRDIETDTGGGITGPDYEITVVDDGHRSWSAWLSEMTDSLLADVDGRFADLVPEIQTYLEENRDLLDGEFEPVPAHNDYRYWNLLLDPATGETEAVLDFGNEFTVHGEYNLAQVEHHLCGWRGLESERRERVREHLFEGYTETNALQRDGNLWEQYDYYLLATGLRGLAWFSTWHERTREADREENADQLRTAVERIIG